MREINEIIIHCSATREGRDFRAYDIHGWHLSRGYKMIGYHFVVDLDGTVECGRAIAQVGAHCYGHNKKSIGICYVGGLDAEGKPKDTRTDAQKRALLRLILQLVGEYPIKKISGHREYNMAKSCPCFDVAEDYKEIARGL